MEIATLVYQKYLVSRGIEQQAWSFIRKALIKLLRDPVCSLPIHKKYLKLPLSHPLPDYLNQFSFYDKLPERISNYIHEKQGHLSCIDIGANIGDTIASFYKKDTDTFLAIEPDPKFYELLAENWGENRNVKVVSEICSSESNTTTFIIQKTNGTASILQTENGITMSRRKLDEIVQDYPFAMNSNVIKIDTDGHDFEVIKGSKMLLSQNLPAILFECDAFENSNYFQDCLEILKFLKQNGYNYFLLYDNIGYLIGKYSLSDLVPFQNLLFYQLTSNSCYFDILVMKDEDIFQFYQVEIDYFTDHMPNKSLQAANVVSALDTLPLVNQNVEKNLKCKQTMTNNHQA